MKQEYDIEVDCANCAEKMQAAAGKVSGVKEAVINFILQRMVVEFEEGVDRKGVMKEVVRACKRVEPDCEIGV